MTRFPVAKPACLLGICLLTGILSNLRADAPAENAASRTATGGTPANAEKTSPADAPEPEKKLFSGKVVLAQAALKARGIKVADEMKDQAVLETPDGELIPVAADWRGRALYQDKRLRDRKLELVGYRRTGVPYLQVLQIYLINDKGEREAMDYWCDICAIPMYEIKECECCQGPIRLRLEPATLPDYLISPKTPNSDE